MSCTNDMAAFHVHVSSLMVSRRAIWASLRSRIPPWTLRYLHSSILVTLIMTTQAQSDSGFGMFRSILDPKSTSEKRAAEAKRILTKYPDRIPVIVEKSARSTLPEIDKKKFLVPGSMLCGEFKYIIHKHLQSQLANSAESLSAEQTLYLFVKNTPPRTGMLRPWFAGHQRS